MLALASVASGARADSETIYVRATPLDARTGVVEIRSVQEALADVPIDCADAEPRSFGCTSGERFARVYGLRFALERRTAETDLAHLEREDRGRAYLFLHLDRDDLGAFDDELRARLSGLAADAFVDEYAGLAPRDEPFSGMARLSPRPSWSCFEHGASRMAAEYRRETGEDANGRTTIVSSGTTVFASGPAVDPLCLAGPPLERSAPADEIRTMPSARALREQSVVVSAVDRLPDVVRAEDLLPLPEGFSYTVHRRPGVRSSTSRSSRDGEIRASVTRNEVETRADVFSASFPTHFVETTGWIARWTVETLDRELGARPRETHGQPIVLRSALVPILPPTPLDAEGRPAAPPPERIEPRFDADAYLREIASRLDRAARLDDDTVARTISGDPAGLGSSGFVLFVCRDRRATFELVPTGASTDVVNAGELCAAIDRALASAGG